jgi:hypothetical protein
MIYPHSIGHVHLAFTGAFCILLDFGPDSYRDWILDFFWPLVLPLHSHKKKKPSYYTGLIHYSILKNLLHSFYNIRKVSRLQASTSN